MKLEEMLVKVKEFVDGKTTDGCSAKEITEECGIASNKVWSVLKQLQQNGDCFYVKNKGNVFIVYSTLYNSKEEIEKMYEKKAQFGNNLQDVLIDAIAKFSVDNVISEVMPLIREKCVNEFGMVPITHEIKIANKNQVKINNELPPCFDRILSYSANNVPCMMTGPAGTGKGYLARTVAKSLGAVFFEVNAVQNFYDLTGFMDANSKFVKTPFYDACKCVAEGGKAVFLFDEMDCSNAETLKIFNEALEAREFTFPNNEHLEFEDLVILAACNTFGTGSDELYCGEQLDASTLDRFSVVRVDYNRKVELNIANGDEELVDFIDEFRKQVNKNGFAFIVSYRSLKRIVNMRECLPLKYVMKDCFLKSLSDDDLEIIMNNLNCTDSIYYKACKGENVKYVPKNNVFEQESLFAL